MAGVVTTIRDKCKSCYNCVRSCPAKAIKVEDGQAQVIEERCIACGFCFRVCAQQAKQIQYAIDKVYELLKGDAPVIACLASSFPALFPGAKPEQVISAVRALGFDEVVEVAFGGELVAHEYARLLRGNDRLLISSTCSAAAIYVQKYFPSLVPYLAPVVSPAVATGRMVKSIYRPGAKTVFIGPCIAMKAEIADPNVTGALDVALTYNGLKRMLRNLGVVVAEQPLSIFDGPQAGMGRLMSLSGGVLAAVGLRPDILDNKVVVAQGKDNVIAILQGLERGEVHARFVDIHFCQGCIDGPTLEAPTSIFARKEAVADFARLSTSAIVDPERLEASLAAYAEVELARNFTPAPIVRPHPSEEEIGRILERIGKRNKSDQLNCGACGYATCRKKAVAVYEGLAEVEMCMPFLISELQASLRQL
ncbi:MAG: [Fe-Fe] hydrogenase large subunit C-terminal domain-containing protein, partial [Chloroflexota bacterium]